MNPIVLIHGALGAASDLEPVAQALSEATDRPIYIYNVPGHGTDDQIPEGGFRMTEIARGFGFWLSEKNLLGVDVFGYSMGGYVALLAVKDHPQRIRHIVTLGTFFDWNPEGARKETKYLNPSLIKEKVPAYAKTLEQIHGERWGEVMEATASLMLDLGEQPLLTEYALSTIQHPVVIGRGGLDRMVGRTSSEQVADTLPDGLYEEPGQWEHPIAKVPLDELVPWLVKRLIG